MSGKPDFYAITRDSLATLSTEQVQAILDSGTQWDLAPVLRSGGAILFGHLHISLMGEHLAATIRACMQCGAKVVLALGVLHAATDALQQARVRVAAGEAPFALEGWGIQGPGAPAPQQLLQHWQREFSMLNFVHLWEAEVARRATRGLSSPQLVLRYPYLAGGRPHLLRGMDELRQLRRDGAVLVGTMDPFHHGRAYGDNAESSLAPTEGGMDLCKRVVDEAMQLLCAGDYWGFNQHCVSPGKSDGRDVGQAMRHLLRRPLQASLLDWKWADMTVQYRAEAPSWVAAALISLQPREPLETDLH